MVKPGSMRIVEIPESSPISFGFCVLFGCYFATGAGTRGLMHMKPVIYHGAMFLRLSFLLKYDFKPKIMVMVEVENQGVYLDRIG